MNELSILIPTVEYSQYLDVAIESCFNAKYIEPTIYININSKSTEFQKSKFWNNKNINWRYATKPGSNMYENVNDAIENSSGKWIFILSDDDIIKKNFMKAISLSVENYDFLYCVNQIEMIDENSNFIENTCRYIKPGLYTNPLIIEHFLLEHLRHHISLLCFSRKLVEKLNYFTTNLGYPNGYYGDYVFFGKAIANSSKVYVESDIVFSRRETSTQGSAKFYFSNVTQYFELITQELNTNEMFKYYIDKYYGSVTTFKVEMMKHRALIEWSKLQITAFNKSKLMYIKFLYYFMFHWKVPVSFKLCFLIAKFSTHCFPEKIDSLYKSNLHGKYCKIKKYIFMN